MMDHARLRELAAGAALDDLEPAEAHALGEHLRECRSCRDLREDLDRLVGELALMAPPLHPPADLRGQVLGAIRADGPASLALAAPVAGGAMRAGMVSPAAPARTLAVTATELGGRGAPWRWAGYAIAAVFAVAVVGLAVQVRGLDQDLANANQALLDTRSQLQTRQAAVALAADPQHRTTTLHAESIAPNANAVVMYRPGTTDSMLVATDLPATPADHVYQLWFADTGGVHPLGTFRFDGVGAFVAPFGVDLGGSAAAMVTLEPIGGAVGDPGPQVVFGEL